eukprot:g3687.t1
MFDKPVVIDCRGHLIGRLASVIAKELLCGQKVVAVRCEQLEGSGSLFRAQVRFQYFLNKRHLTNPKKGPIHHRSPARVLWRTVRGMIPHKTARGQHALHRLKAYEGIPAPYSSMKRMVVPQALRVLRLKPFRKYHSIGQLCSDKGWKHADLIKRLEAKRVEGSNAYYEKKKAATQAKDKAAADGAVASIDSELAQFGY